MSEEDNIEFEYQAFFSGICTCNHSEDVHGWGGCNVYDDAGHPCQCEAGWEE